jgi:cytochrome c biogenesis protein CcmG/thiol:disulfide interchange protein DsbE
MGIGMFLTVPALYFLARGFDFDPRDLPDAVVGQVAPGFTRPSLDGYEISLSDLKGGPVVINFWATWCQPCKAEHAHLISTANRFKPKGVAFLGVLYGDEADKATRYLKRAGSAYPTLVDESQSIPIDYGVGGVPETFVVDKDGTIIKKFTGPVTEGELAIVLESLL